MIAPLNRIGPHVACLGNHEFDMGIQHAETLLSETKVPWLMTNFTYKDGSQIANSLPFHILETQGYKLGFIGLADQSFVDTFSSETMDMSTLVLNDPLLTQ